MKFQLILVFVILTSIFACRQKPIEMPQIDAKNLSDNQIDSILTKFKFQYEAPLVLDSSDHVLIPISTEMLGRRKKISVDGYYKNDFPRYWNVLFYNRKTNETRLLSENKLRISEIHARQDKYDERTSIFNQMILYKITDIDTNKDKQLNAKDPSSLFSSNQDGTNLKRISPLDEDLQFFTVVPNSKQILIKTLRDKNEDLLFDREDETIWYRAEYNKGVWSINEIIDSTGRKQIENLYFQQWLSKQEE